TITLADDTRGLRHNGRTHAITNKSRQRVAPHNVDCADRKAGPRQFMPRIIPCPTPEYFVVCRFRRGPPPIAMDCRRIGEQGKIVCAVEALWRPAVESDAIMQLLVDACFDAVKQTAVR